MNSRPMTRFGSAVTALFLATAAFLLICRPARIHDEWRIVTISDDGAYLCTTTPVEPDADRPRSARSRPPGR